MLIGTPPSEAAKYDGDHSVIERKAAIFRLYPTPKQCAPMAQIAGACRFVCNLALEQSHNWYLQRRAFNFASQCREVTALRAEEDWLKAGRAGAPKPHQKSLKPVEENRNKRPVEAGTRLIPARHRFDTSVRRYPAATVAARPHGRGLDESTSRHVGMRAA